MSDSRKDLPSVNANNFLARVRETLQGYLGTNGNVLDRGVTVRDLSDAGIVRVNPAFLSGGSGTPIIGVGSAVSTGGTGGGTTVVVTGPSEPAYVPDYTKPPAPTGFFVGAGLTHLQGGIADPSYTVGHGHDRSRLYGVTYSGTGPLPTFSQAVELTQFTGKIFAYPTEPATTWHLWVTHVSKDGVESDAAGGTNGVAVTTGQDVALLLDALSGQIDSSQLAPALTSSLLNTEITAGLASDTATLAWNNTNWLGNSYTVRTSVSVDGKTLVGGFGLAGTDSGSQGASIDFGVVADKFWIGAPQAAGVTGVQSVKPFVVQTTDTTVNGVVIPKGVYMDAAYIKNLEAMIARLGTAWIKTAMIADAQIVDAHIANLNAEKITAGQIAADRINGAGLTIKNAAGGVLLDASGESVPPWVVKVDSTLDPGALPLASPQDGNNRARIRSILVDGVGLKSKLTPSGNSVELSASASEVWRVMYATTLALGPADGIVQLDYATFQLEAGRTYSIEVRVVGNAVSTNTTLELYFQTPAGCSGTLPDGTGFTGGDILKMADCPVTTTGTTYVNPTVFRMLVNCGATAGQLRFHARGVASLRMLRGTEFKADRIERYVSPLAVATPTATYYDPMSGERVQSSALSAATGQPYQAVFTVNAMLTSTKTAGFFLASLPQLRKSGDRIWFYFFATDYYIWKSDRVRFTSNDFTYPNTFAMGGTAYALVSSHTLLRGYTAAEADRWTFRVTKKAVSFGPGTAYLDPDNAGDRTETYKVSDLLDRTYPIATGTALNAESWIYDAPRFGGDSTMVPAQAVTDYTVETLFMGSTVGTPFTYRMITNFV